MWEGSGFPMSMVAPCNATKTLQDWAVNQWSWCVWRCALAWCKFKAGFQEGHARPFICCGLSPFVPQLMKQAERKSYSSVFKAACLFGSGMCCGECSKCCSWVHESHFWCVCLGIFIHEENLFLECSVHYSHFSGKIYSHFMCNFAWIPVVLKVNLPSSSGNLQPTFSGINGRQTNELLWVYDAGVNYTFCLWNLSQESKIESDL